MSTVKSFNELGLDPAVLSALVELGYELPTPVQEQSIPVLMNDDDLLAQAQTGTGKTAAFALPILSKLDLPLKEPQAIIITPTRELAIQVAEAFQAYGKHLKNFQVAPIYGGQSYSIQLKALKRGAHIVVGTPGRVMDHLRRGTLSLRSLKNVILDEADEMLKMGFVEDIEWILEQIPHDHQTSLFSATMPTRIQKIVKHYLTNPKKVHVKPKETTVNSIEQLYVMLNNNQKLEALTRFLEMEAVNAAIIFTRTKNTSSELAEKLQARGYAAAALNGNMNQTTREKVLSRIKKNILDIIVATDVAARGIDVEHVTHVVNYDIPHDVESYIHRIGRTGRAGRKGKALLFVTPREQRLLKDIERAVHSNIKKVEPPSAKEISDQRIVLLKEKLASLVTDNKKLKPYHEMVADLVQAMGCSPEDIAASLAYMMQQLNPLPMNDLAPPTEESSELRRRRRHAPGSKGRDVGNRRPSRKPEKTRNKKRRSTKEAKSGDKRPKKRKSRR